MALSINTNRLPISRKEVVYYESDCPLCGPNLATMERVIGIDLAPPIRAWPLSKAAFHCFCRAQADSAAFHPCWRSTIRVSGSSVRAPDAKRCSTLKIRRRRSSGCWGCVSTIRQVRQLSEMVGYRLAPGPNEEVRVILRNDPYTVAELVAAMMVELKRAPPKAIWDSR